MGKKRVLIQALVVLLVVWAVIMGVRAIAESHRVTAKKIAAEIEAGAFEDWSDGIPDGAPIAEREEKIREIAGMFNELDFGERQRAHNRGLGRGLYDSLADSEKELFVDLTITKGMQDFMRALDAMNPEQRRRIVERAMREIEEGDAAADMKEAKEVSEAMLNRITQEGLRAYFQEAGTDTKLDMAPLMQAMDDIMKGMHATDFGQSK